MEAMKAEGAIAASAACGAAVSSIDVALLRIVLDFTDDHLRRQHLDCVMHGQDATYCKLHLIMCDNRSSKFIPANHGFACSMLC